MTVARLEWAEVVRAVAARVEERLVLLRPASVHPTMHTQSKPRACISLGTPHRGIPNLLLRCILVSTIIGSVVCAVAAAMMHGGMVAPL
jgi:hypothetical protein